MPHALIVDDDAVVRSTLAELVARDGFTASVAESLAEARKNLEPFPDLVLVDLVLPDGSGIELLSEPRIHERSDMVFITGHASVESSVNAMRLGATDYLTKPVDLAKLSEILARLAATDLRCDLKPARGLGRFVGTSSAMRKLYAAMERIAPTDATVLIVGESGTGKEVVARSLHEMSTRHAGPYVAVNCGAVSPNLIESELFGHEKGSFTGATHQHAGYFERAHGGTLFLDEVTEMPRDLQVRLLRVLESRIVSRVGSSKPVAIDVRVIAATNRDPYEAVKTGKLREDLLYRLQVLPLHVPPLRERPGDITQLARHFVDELNRKSSVHKRFSPTVLEGMERYNWPGNVRELYNVVQRAHILAEGRMITHSLPQPDRLGAVTPAVDGFHVAVGDSLAEVERRLIMHTVRRCRTQEEAARILGISTKTLYNKQRIYDVRPPGRRCFVVPTGVTGQEEKFD